ncbi:BTAD domain-containing putative transcriptional regulator [Amycolatopsis sp. EV170708-02-1]|uniref:BTAD domain-containing putative transcriptional regulator n=1 Tax=Amycolatopsis sp. EV170708-02-1 TaxID=2919322 RepID=UPI001F0C1D19|nr:BTAD domain-containing putative transcriptional regulator [Amycolatopsis sp. EV170708-02-1]UMO99732.1 winged helix-turn-helix domain-containing protein [Amycolatopsis sp. EV170708-02-1]
MDEVSSLTVRLLGGSPARHGDGEIALGPAQRQAVFATLALHAGQFVSRREIIDAVWGERPPDSATGIVYTYVSALRRALEPVGEPLVASRAGYRLDLPKQQVDVHVFEAELDRARAHRLDGAHQRELESLRSALGQWQGSALDGIPGPFAETERARLNELRLSALERQAEVTLRLGGHHELVDELAVLVERHPLREGLHRMLITALFRSGRQAEALAAFDRARETIIERSGLEPGPDLLDLRRRILDDDPSLHLRDRTQAVPGRPSAFVGREFELGRLRRHLSALLDEGRGGTVWLDGEAGGGKSAFLAEALATVRSRTRWVEADELSGAVPMSLIADCLGGEALDDLGKTVTGLCEAGPQVLVFEDLHWADEESLLAWQRLHRLTAHLPLLLIGSARPLPRRRTLDLLRSEFDGEIVPLPPFDGPAVAALAEETLARDPGDGFLAFSTEYTAGNAAYLRELFSAFAEGHEPDTAPHGRLAAVVEDHLATLSVPCKRTLNSAALLGSSFTVADLAGVTGREPRSLTEAVDEALAAQVLEAGGEGLRFRVPLIRAVFAANTPPAIRAVLHQEIATTMADSGAPADRVAEQLLQAGDELTAAWIPRWVLDNVRALSAEPAVELLHLLSRQRNLTEEQHQELTGELAALLLPGPDTPPAWPTQPWCTPLHALARVRNPAAPRTS